MNTTSTMSRLDEIADRNSKSRILDFAFAAMIALLLVLSVASLRSAAAQSVSHSATSYSETYPAELAGHDGTCDVETVNC
jgi:hypothetical protein